MPDRVTRSVAALAAFLMCGAGSSVVPRAEQGNQRRPVEHQAVLDLLQSYERGTPVTFGDHTIATVAAGLHGLGSHWIAEAPKSERARRLDIVALAALEAADAALSDTPLLWRTGSIQGVPKTEDPGSLVEWGCDLLRAGAPTEFERVWLLASIAVIQRVGDAAFLRSPAAGCGRLMPCDHVSHALSRFPDEPRFKLARALSFPETNKLTNHPGLTTKVLLRDSHPSGAYIVPLIGVHFDEPENAEQVTGRFGETFKRLAALYAVRDVGAEARLHAGILHFELNELPASAADLAAASASDDSFVSYLAHLVAGLAKDAGGQDAEASAEFRAALTVIPRARAATTALAAHLFMAGARAEATSLLDATYAAPADEEPWVSFDAGDYRFWLSYVHRLHDLVRR